MNSIKKFTLVHQTPEHFILREGQAHFHIAKKGLGKDLISKIQGFAEGGQVESEEDKIGKSVSKGVDPEKASQFHPFVDGGKVPKYEGLAPEKPEPEATPYPSQPVVSPEKAAQFHPFSEGGNVLDANARKHIAEKNFALPGRRYPIEDATHARNALARVSQHGTPAEKTTVRAKVHSKYPGIEQQHMADGGEVDHNQDSDQEQRAQELNTSKEDHSKKEMLDQAKSYNNLMKQMQEHIQRFPGGGEVQPMEVNITPEEEAQAAHAGDETPAPAASPQDVAAAQESAQGLADVTGTPMPQASAAGQTVPPEQQVSFVPPSSAPAASIPALTDKYAVPQTLDQAMQQEASATGATAEAQAKAASQTADTMKGFVEQEQKRQNIVNAHLQEIDKQNDQLFKDATTGKINPNRLWQNTSTPGKISAALGLILGGIGSGMTGQPNQAAHFIENAIAHDIEAQKLDKSNAMSAYKMGLEKYKDTQSASAFATVQANTLVAAKLQQIAANSQNPAIIANAQKEIAGIYTKMAPLKMEMAQRALALQLTSGGAMNINPEGLAPEYRERSVQLPNGQIALAPTKEDATTVKKALNSYGNIDNQLNDMYNTLKQEGRAVNPLGSYAAKSASMRDNIILELNHLHDLNRLNEREFDTYKKMVPGPGDLLQNRAIAKIVQLKNIIKGHTQSEFQEHLTNYKQPQIQTGPPTFNQQPVGSKQFNKMGR